VGYGLVWVGVRGNPGRNADPSPWHPQIPPSSCSKFLIFPKN